MPYLTTSIWPTQLSQCQSPSCSSHTCPSLPGSEVHHSICAHSQRVQLVPKVGNDRSGYQKLKHLHLDEIDNEASVSPNKGRPFLAHPDAHPAIRTFCFLLNLDTLHCHVFLLENLVMKCPPRSGLPLPIKPSFVYITPILCTAIKLILLLLNPLLMCFLLLYFIHYES